MKPIPVMYESEIKKYKQIMAQSTRLKNKLEKVLKRLVYIGSTRPISFNIDKMIESLSANGFPTERIHKKQVGITLTRSEKTEFSYNVNGVNCILYIPETIRYNTPDIRTIIYEYLDRIFKEVAHIYIPQRADYLSQKTGLKFNKCNVNAIRNWGYFYHDTKNITISSKLITASKEEIDAIIIHELCHSLEDLPGSKVKNHNLYYHEAFLKYAGRELYDLSFKYSILRKRL